MVGKSALNVGTLAARDDSIIKKEFYPYTPFTTSFGDSEEIRIAIQSQDSYLLPCESYIYMQIAVTSRGTAGVGDPPVRFVTNFASFLFSDARYELNGVEIDRVKDVGRSSTMKLRIASLPSHINSYGTLSAAMEATTPTDPVNAEVLFDVVVPLSVWFGFCDDYRKVMLNCKHVLVLNRSPNTLNCVEGGGTLDTTARVTLELRKIVWKMPHLTLADDIKLGMLNYLSKNRKITAQYRSMDLAHYPTLPQSQNNMWTVKTVSHMHRPRYVVVGLQTNRNSTHVNNAAQFDRCRISEVRLHLNSQIFPYNMSAFNLHGAEYSELYDLYKRVQPSYYNNTEAVNEFTLNYASYQSSPLFVFDTSRADESLIDSSVDVKVEIKTSRNIPPNTAAFCLIIYDNQFTYSPFDGIVTRNI